MIEKSQRDKLKAQISVDAVNEANSASEANSKKRKRLNLDLTPEAYELLQKLADESGHSMAGVLRTGLTLYGIAQEEMKKGHSLGIVEGDKIIKEIILP